MSRQYNDLYKTPSVVGRLERSMVRAIHEKFPDTCFDLGWPGDVKKGGYEEQFSILGPLHRQVLKVAGGRVNRILYSVDVRDIPAGSSQRTNTWYCNEDDLSLVGADVLPDEVVVVDPNIRLNGEADRKRHALLNDYRGHHAELRKMGDAALRRAGLKIVMPKPFQLVALEGHVHRSPINLSGRLQRCWVRASVTL